MSYSCPGHFLLKPGEFLPCRVKDLLTSSHSANTPSALSQSSCYFIPLKGTLQLLSSAQVTPFSAWWMETTACAATPYLGKPRGVHLFSIPGLSSKAVSFFSPCSYAAKFKKTHAAIKQPWRKAPNGVTLLNQSQRLTRAHPCCGFTGRVNRAELCSAGGWLAWSSLPCLGKLQLPQPQSPRCRMLPQPPLQGCRAASPSSARPALPGTAFSIIISQ